ncbi:unnamed protein product [Mytilus edulis]|uniref:Uncharacterized protein n=1 Tax=Mytilus edulis TaxID=6550 RepID=A0A8S3RQG8_MYTED|nr:unnamed protein product [Mytilus edulis]
MPVNKLGGLDFKDTDEAFEIRPIAETNVSASSPCSARLPDTSGVSQPDDTQGLTTCYVPQCHQKSTKTDCFSELECNWCEYTDLSQQIAIPCCRLKEECTFGKTKYQYRNTCAAVPSTTTDKSSGEIDSCQIGGIIGGSIAFGILLTLIMICGIRFGPHSVDMFSLDSNAMLDNEGFEISHFTPYKTPLSSGVDAFAQIYKSSEIYYAFPPFCLISAVVKFIIQEKITCTLIFPDFKPVKPWFTVILSYSKEIVTIGYKGDKGVLLYPSKKGFLPDKRGLQCNLCAAKFSFIGDNNTCADKYSKIISTNPQKFIPVLFIGDSIIRFLTDVYDNVHVVSNGGAKLMDSFHCLIRLIDILDVFVVIFHSGTNDLNKHFKPGDIQLKNAKKIYSMFSVLYVIYKQSMI